LVKDTPEHIEAAYHSFELNKDLTKRMAVIDKAKAEAQDIIAAATKEAKAIEYEAIEERSKRLMAEQELDDIKNKAPELYAQIRAQIRPKKDHSLKQEQEHDHGVRMR
jgi:cell division septum initiation protein DivIVA